MIYEYVFGFKATKLPMQMIKLLNVEQFDIKNIKKWPKIYVFKLHLKQLI